MKKELTIALLAMAAFSDAPSMKAATGSVPSFPIYSYNSIGRDPFISPDSPLLRVSQKLVAAAPQDTETLAALLKKLKKDLLANYKVVGVCVDPDPSKSSALVDISERKVGADIVKRPIQTNAPAAGPTVPSQAGTDAIPDQSEDPAALLQKIDQALDPAAKHQGQLGYHKSLGHQTDVVSEDPPEEVTIKTGFPVRANTSQSSYITRLSAKIAIEGGLKLRRDLGRDLVYMPIKSITSIGVHIGFPGSEVSILIPCNQDLDTTPSYERPKSAKKDTGLL